MVVVARRDGSWASGARCGKLERSWWGTHLARGLLWLGRVTGRAGDAI